MMTSLLALLAVHSGGLAPEEFLKLHDRLKPPADEVMPQGAKIGLPEYLK